MIGGGGELAMTAFYPPDLADPSAVVRQVADYDQRQAALEAERGRLEAQGDDAARAALQRLETLDTLGGPPFDAILIADGGDRLRSVASLLTFYDVDPARDPLPRHHALAGRSRRCWRRRRCVPAGSPRCRPRP